MNSQHDQLKVGLNDKLVEHYPGMVPFAAKMKCFGILFMIM